MAVKWSRRAKSFHASCPTARRSMPACADRLQKLVYVVTLRPLRTTTDVDGAPVALGPGLEVAAEITTGGRRITDCLFAPLVQTKSEALLEG
jgi:hypothetical protein